MSSHSKNLMDASAKMVARTKAKSPSTKKPKPAEKVFGPQSQPALAPQAGTNR